MIVLIICTFYTGEYYHDMLSRYVLSEFFKDYK